MNNTGHGLCVLTLCISILLLVPDISQGGNFFNSVRHGVSSARHRVESSYSHARKKAGHAYQSTSRRVKNNLRRKREQAANYAREKERQTRARIERDRRRAREIRRQRQKSAGERLEWERRKAAERVARKRRRAQRVYADKRRQAKSWTNRRLSTMKTSSGTVLNRARNSFSNSTGKLRNLADSRRFKAQRNLARYRSELKAVSKRYGTRTVSRLTGIRRSYGDRAARAMTAQLARMKNGGGQVIRDSEEAMDRAKFAVRNPRNRALALHGLAIAGGLTYYAYTHTDDIEYKVIRYGLNNVTINHHGKAYSAGEVVTNAILNQAPYLRGTRLAEDPAAVLAYGVVSVGKDDMINQIPLLPDGHGHRRTIRDTVGSVDTADQAIAALQVSNAAEGMALNAARNGQFGMYGQDFASSYNHMEETFGDN